MEKKKEEEFDRDEAMERLVKVMNDSPTIVKLGENDIPITALKPGTQWLIAEESCKIVKAEKGNMNDVIKQFSLNIPSVVKVLTLAILNDKDRIYKDYRKKVFSDEYEEIYDTIMWETDPNNWIGLLVEVLSLLSMEYFFDTTSAIEKIREMALAKKMTMEEQESSSLEQNTDK